MLRSLACSLVATVLLGIVEGCHTTPAEDACRAFVDRCVSPFLTDAGEFGDATPGQNYSEFGGAPFWVPRCEDLDDTGCGRAVGAIYACREREGICGAPCSTGSVNPDAPPDGPCCDEVKHAFAACPPSSP